MYVWEKEEVRERETESKNRMKMTLEKGEKGFVQEKVWFGHTNDCLESFR